MRHTSPTTAFGIAAIALILCVASPAAVLASTTLEQANSSFASGDYHSAIDQYQSLLAQQGFSASVLFDLGNAYYRDGQIGAAILSYERAQVLAPRDSEIAANLRLARAKSGVAEPAMTSFDRLARLISPNTLAWIGSAALTLLCITIALRRLMPRSSFARPLFAFSFLVLATVVVNFAVRWQQLDRAIVVATAAPARIAPASTAAESFALKAGQPITISKTYGQFALIYTPDGRSGWVSNSDVGRVFAISPTANGQGKI